ncbi:hypothetical protein Btru_071679 [Bulinus truncatus]|nr:hypothetical protein Btru_071679 [Bulinus truncatus]
MLFSWNCALCLVSLGGVFWSLTAADPPSLCDEAEQNQTALASLGSTVEFSACVRAVGHRFSDEYVTHLNDSPSNFYQNETFAMSFTVLSSGVYRVQLTRRDVRSVDFGTHVVTVRSKTTLIVVLSVFLTLLPEENRMLTSVLPYVITSLVAAVVIAIAIFKRCKGDRCKIYRIHREITLKQRFLRCLTRKNIQPQVPLQVNEDHFYATVDDVEIHEVAERSEWSHDSDSAERASFNYAGYITPLDLQDSGYITPSHVKRSPKPTKHLSLQKSSQGQTNPYRLDCYRSSESLCATRPLSTEGYSPYCNCQFIQITTEPKLLGMRRLSDRRSGKPNVMAEDINRKCCTVTDVSNDAPESKKSKFKCQKYVNINDDLEKYFESFRNVNKFMDKKRTAEKVINLNHK